MVAFGFPSATIRWLQTLYETSEARVILNGTFGKPVVSEREIKQGFPLAMLLYIIYIGPLLLLVKKELTCICTNAGKRMIVSRAKSVLLLGT